MSPEESPPPTPVPVDRADLQRGSFELAYMLSDYGQSIPHDFVARLNAVRLEIDAVIEAHRRYPWPITTPATAMTP